MTGRNSAEAIGVDLRTKQDECGKIWEGLGVPCLIRNRKGSIHNPQSTVKQARAEREQIDEQDEAALHAMRTTSLPSALLGVLIPNKASAFLRAAPRGSSHLTRSRIRMSSSEVQVEVEVEQKFPLPADIAPVEDRLRKLGFVPKGGGPVSFVDTYYDVPAPCWYLTQRDTWLRFRGVKQRRTDGGWEGKWQLKIRRKSSEGDDSAAVAYEEIQGDTALNRVSEILASASLEGDGGGDEITDAPLAPRNLVPFAQFETTRSSWVIHDEEKMPSSEYLGLSVDIDSTDFGYGVGEVEAILNKGDGACMADARKRIGQLVAEIYAASEQTESATPNAATSELPIFGKLETYLMEKRPRHYNAIISAGIFKPV